MKTNPQSDLGPNADQIHRILEELEGDIAALREKLSRARDGARRPVEEYLLAYA